jgi:hypothetical protein
MRYIIERTSLWDDKVSPCDEAVLTDVIKTESLAKSAVDNPRWRQAKQWYTAPGYENHREVKVGGGIQLRRDIQGYTWIVELWSLDELHAFIRKHGELVVSHWTDDLSFVDGSKPDGKIEIYDNYRE